MIDSQGYRPNVGIILCNHLGQVLWAKRIGQNGWQFPQGGIQANEKPEEAMYRELYEEIGLKKQQVKVLASTRGWLRYRLPKHMVRNENRPLCVGQKQKWFLLKLLTADSTINVSATESPEFDDWQWVNYWYPIGQVVAFKRDVYRRAMAELAPRISRLQRQLN